MTCTFTQEPWARFPLKVESRCISLLTMGVPKSDDYARTSMRLTIWGCLAGLAVVFAIPVYILVAVLLFG